ncbi:MULTISPECIES: FCD domain-containing protein [Psychrilyobacter]|uniref:FCD domain-containing protein n=1 Tax=Psychrilyobacter piezotolerans TaxID=2293438 RepID=A0ABX9KI13_9FUSO|nr:MULTISPECIES: FCD domain-containing protein [Psychrilyobacter]MCS5422353.1 FCD domain-containing protein [Psychrilyobacter sp. S5]NDI78038.1 FCD domain-containing protein [Psychrilyobacter piezotolerans]RDE61975.1 FCD domain-containing protein [Psychrilyobacter sp. S5]REI41201.1 FCD domain-containing protein [Psychrilyobacter piezotolerans]
MNNDEINYDYSILRLLEKHKKPTGASLIKRELKNLKINISEATIGRILFDLDNIGFTLKDGYRGRVITDKGKLYLNNLQRKKDRREKGELFLSALNIQEIDRLLEALEARKVIESQMAKFAAAKSNIQTKKDFKRIIESHEKMVKNLTEYEYNIPFHKYIATLAGNKILELMLQMVVEDTRFTPALKKIEKNLGMKTIEEHKNIAHAIIEKNPEAAEKAMADHIDSLIVKVKKVKLNLN